MIISCYSLDSLDVDMFCMKFAKVNTFVAFEDPIFILITHCKWARKTSRCGERMLVLCKNKFKVNGCTFLGEATLAFKILPPITVEINSNSKEITFSFEAEYFL